MSGKRAKLDLSFGAEVSPLPALQSSIFRDIDGKAYAFTASAPATPNLSSLLATGMSLTHSKNGAAHSRIATNKLLHRSLSRFARWASTQPSDAFSEQSLTRFRNHLFDNGAATTAYGVYTVLARTAGALIEAGHIPRFNIPANASKTQVTASSASSGASLASALPGATHASGADEANELLMKAWLDAAWTEIDVLFEKIKQGRRWRGEVGLKWDLPPELDAYLKLMALTHPEALALCKTICVRHLKSQLPEAFKLTQSLQAEPSSWRRSLIIIATRFGSRKEKGLTPVALAEALEDPSVALLVDIPSWASAPMVAYSGDKASNIKLVVQCLQKKFKGHPPAVSISHRFPGEARDKWVDAIDFLLAQSSRLGIKISAPELVSYFHPTPAMVGLAASILCSAQINPGSVMHLSVNSLGDDPSNPKLKRMQWSKGRAGGPQAAIPFPVGGATSRTIPRLWASLVDASSELRAQAPKAIQSALFLWTSGDSGPRWLCHFDQEASIANVWKYTRNYLAGDIESAKPNPASQAALGPMAKHLQEVTLSLLRRTAIDIASARLDRDFKSTAGMDGRQSVATLETSYLNNAQTKSHLDQQIRQGQKALDAWLRSPPIVLPADEDAVAATLAVDLDTARSLLSDELNGGMGASLLNHQAIFIDSPLNALRMIQWLEKLGMARARMLRDNPIRWNAVYEPQVGLFQEALHSFSRIHVAKARKMSLDIELPFPAIH